MHTSYASLVGMVIWLIDHTGEAKEEGKVYIPQPVSPAFLSDWPSLHVRSAKAGKTTKQDIALVPNTPTSTIIEPIIFPLDIDPSTGAELMTSIRAPVRNSSLKGTYATHPRTAVRGNKSRVKSRLNSPRTP